MGNELAQFKCQKSKTHKKLNGVLNQNSGLKIVLKMFEILRGEVENINRLSEKMKNYDILYRICQNKHMFFKMMLHQK